jgi:murein DD-endopeptidase MepM/ murein hydrolase activator NlpD
MARNRLHVLVLAVLAAGAVACARSRDSAADRAPRADVMLPRETETIDARVPRNATLDSLLSGHGLAPDLVAAAIEVVRPIFDPRRLRADQPYRLVRGLDGSLRRFRYEIDGDRFLDVARRGDGLEARILPFEKETAVVSLRAAIDEDHPSIIAALDEAGESVELAIVLADILSGEVDFNNDLQVGDTIDVVFERHLREGRAAGYGAILAAELVNEGRRVRAFRFAGPDGKAGYYDDRGRSLRRFFLRSPLPFQPRITSRFSRSRLHPVYRTYRAHLGVDYGAPVGTAVLAVANGVVVSAGFSGGSGRMVHLRHADGYESYYLHLSSFAPGVVRGVRVQQGQLIGRVGSSGTATGPHLDYRLRRNGAFVNPLTVHRNMPPGTPVDPRYRAAFLIVRDRVEARFTGNPRAPADRTAPPEKVTPPVGGR